ALSVIWLAVHPTLQERLSSHHVTLETVHRPSAAVIVAKTLLSTVSLDAMPHPQEVSVGNILRVLASAVIIGAGAALLVHSGGEPTSRSEGTSNGAGRRLATFAITWAVLGWFPVLLPSIQWHAYYGCLGALGAWFGLGLWLQKRTRIAIALIAGLAV